MGANLMEAARLAKVGKFVAIGTACSYPGYLEGHLKEDDLWAGPCHASVVNYGLTKKMMAVQAQAYKKQYGLDSIHLILTNLYGPGDSYNPDRSHVVAALVRKWVEAEHGQGAEVEVWGTGKPVREFIYVEDCADAIVLAAEKYDDAPMPLNIGTGIGTSIRELAETVNEVVRLQGQDGLERRQARRRDAEGARRDPDEAGPRRLDAADRPAGRAWRRRSPGTGPTRPRRTPNGERLAADLGRPARLDAVRAEPRRPTERPRGSDAAGPAARRGRPDRRRASGPAPAAPVRQPVLLARPRLDGPAPDRPGRVAGRRRGTSATSSAPRARYKPGDAAAAGLRGPQRRPHPPRRRRPRWAGGARCAG